MTLRSIPHVALSPQRPNDPADLQPAVDLAGFLLSHQPFWDDAVNILLRCKDADGYAQRGRSWAIGAKGHGSVWRASNASELGQFANLMEAVYVGPPASSVERRRGRVLEIVAAEIVLSKYPSDTVHLKAKGDVQVVVDGSLQQVQGARELDICVWSKCVGQGAFFECKASAPSLDAPELRLLLLLHGSLHNPLRRTYPVIGVVSFSESRALRVRAQSLVPLTTGLVQHYGADQVWVNLGRHRACQCVP